MLPSVRAEAARPRSHECVVVVESIDLSTGTLHSRSEGSHAKPLKLRWRVAEHTTVDGEPLAAASLRPGQRAVIHHRQPFFGPWPLNRLSVIP